MARILAYTSPARGHLYPSMPILLELVDRGHEVSLRTLASEVQLACDLGIDAAPIDPQIEAIEHDDYGAKGSRAALSRVADVFTRRAHLDGPDIERAIEDHDPDALIIDFNCWGATTAAEARGKPWAAFCPYPTMLSSDDAPPFGPGFAPAQGVAGRVRDRLARPLIFGAVEKAWLPGINELRAGKGLQEIGRADDLMLAPPLMLYMTAEPFDYPRSDWPESFVMVGPCAWEPDVATPQWLDELERPVVLVTTSSEFQDDGKLIEAAFEALSDLPYEVIATAPAGDAASFEVPTNGRVEQFVPHSRLLERAACAVTHGGMGATQKALAHGVPVCAVPFGRDQLEVARRVEVSGAGTRLPSARLSAARLRAKVLEAIELGDGANRIAEAYERTGGAAAAADAIEQRSLARAPGYSIS
ncbi:MAG: glycosyltransferase family 1 protein [Thermoleophilaceae bacterium]|nr:glycosyltransferase family 1 protein [Thermoleophilaceae bacterium]